MKLYIVIASADSTTPDRSIWAGSQAECAAARKELLAEGFKRKDLTTHEIEVPTKKEDLIGFLNLLSSGTSIVAAVEKLTAK